MLKHGKCVFSTIYIVQNLNDSIVKRHAWSHASFLVASNNSSIRSSRFIARFAATVLLTCDCLHHDIMMVSNKDAGGRYNVLPLYLATILL